MIPSPQNCYVHWETSDAVRIRTLFNAVYRIITECVLVATFVDGHPEIFMESTDNTEDMVATFRIRENVCIQKPTNIGINTLDFYKLLKTVIQGDVITIVTEKKRWDLERVLNVYIQNTNYLYEYSYHALAMEFSPTTLEPGSFTSEAVLPFTLFKKIVADCAKQGDQLSFEFKKHEELLEIVFIPSVIGARATEARISVYAKGTIYKDAGTKYYDAKMLMLFTKSPVHPEVRLIFSNDFPLVAEFNIGSMGFLRLLLKPKWFDFENELNMLI